MKKCMGCMQEYSDELNICPHCGYEEGTPPKEAYHMEPGSILHGNYIVGKVVGYGGFGVTYIGYDAELERTVAIKEYMPSEFSTRIPGQTKVTVYEGDKAEQFHGGMEKFVDEAKRLAKFQDMEGIVQIYDSFMENETAYIIMEFLEGETLKEKLERDGKMTLEEALKVIMPIITSFKEVHKMGIIHRDIAPDNIMVTKDGKVKLIDFGASRFATTTHSRSLTVLIKQGYAPVEQYNSRGDQGAWTDVYALAATFYKCLTGITPDDSMERKAKDEMKPPSKRGAKVSKNIDTAIMNAMNISIEYRTFSMEQFEEELLAEKEVARVVEPEHKQDMGRMPLWYKLMIGTIGTAIAVFVGLIAFGVIDFGGLTSGKFKVSQGMTYVPNMVNQDIEQAQLLAEQNDVLIQIVDKQNSDVVPRDLVMAQTPESGNEVSEGSTLELVISAGKEQVYVPAVEGMMQEDAIALLEENRLTYELTETDSNIVAGAVAKQSIPANEQVDSRSCVVLEISTGFIPYLDEGAKVIAPGLQNMNFNEARELLEDMKLRILVVEETYSSTIAAGDIISQNIASGRTLHQGDTIEVVVSLGNQIIYIPDVQYKGAAEARRTLEDSGLVVNIEYAESDLVAPGKVISQSLSPTRRVDWGTKITITVSTGSGANDMQSQTNPTPTPTLAPTPTPSITETPIPTMSPIPTEIPSVTPVQYVGEILPATNLSWSAEEYGTAYWYNPNNTPVIYRVNLLKDGESVVVYTTGNYVFNTPQQFEFEFGEFMVETGTYTFIVELFPAGTEIDYNWNNGCVSPMSSPITYTKPATPLSVPQNVRWGADGTVTWEPVANADYYRVHLVYPDSSYASGYCAVTSISSHMTSLNILEYMTEAREYYVYIEAISNNILLYTHSRSEYVRCN